LPTYATHFFKTMCGRYTLTQALQAIKIHFFPLAISMDHLPRYNIAPTQEVPVVMAANGKRELAAMRWGLIPPWATEKKPGSPMINARAETVHEKPGFRQSFKNKRCLIPADGFIEWVKTGKDKRPQYITLKSGELFAFAGIWSEWKKDGGVLWTFSIITTECNALLQPVHERMPAILAPSDYDAWLAPSSTPADLHSLLRPFPSDAMQMYPIAPEINSPKNDHAECLRPMDSA